MRTTPTETQMNELGLNRWELCHVVGNRYIFKRIKENK